jgi:hypothetical protein
MSLAITIAWLAVCYVPGWCLKESRRGRREEGGSKESKIKAMQQGTRERRSEITNKKLVARKKNLQ